MAPAKSRTGSSPEGTSGLLAAAMLSGATGGIGEIFDCLPISAAAAAAQSLPKHDPGHQPSQLSGDGSFPFLPPPQPKRSGSSPGAHKRWCARLPQVSMKFTMLWLRPEAALAARPGKTGAQTLPDKCWNDGKILQNPRSNFSYCRVVSSVRRARERAREERQRDSVPELQRRN